MKLRALLLCALLLGLVAITGAAAGAGPIELRGHVQDAQGVPMSGAIVFVHDMDNDITNSILTDEYGNFDHSVADGRYSVYADMATYRANTTYSDITSSTDGLDFTMYGLGTVTGYVTDGNTTLPGVKITIKNSAEEFTAFTTSPWGQFTIDNVTAGEYIVTSEMLGYVKSTYPDPLTVARAGTSVLNFTMSEVADKSAQLSGQVTFNGEPVQGAKVTLVPLEGAELVAYTDVHGNYLIKNVTPGAYQLTMARSGYIGSSQRVVLSPLDQKELDVVLKKDNLPGNSGFLFDYDLAHSLMIVALGLSLFTTAVALVLRHRARSKPEMLEKEEDD